jgi:hypothetical protein
MTRPITLIALTLAACFAPALRAQTIEVNSLLDLADADPEDGVADADLATEGLQTTLRAAIQFANAKPGADTIHLPAGKYVLRLKGEHEEAGATGDLDISSDITLLGDGAATTIVDARRLKDRIFDVHDGTVDLGALTLLRGKAPAGETGGGLRVLDGAVTVHDATIRACKSAGHAGGVEVLGGFCDFFDVLLQKNVAAGEGGGLSVDGGDTIMVRVCFDRNRAAGLGGALRNRAGIVTSTNVTFAGNGAPGGGALALDDGAVQLLLNCTLGRNKAKLGSGVFMVEPKDAGFCEVKNTIFADKPLNDCDGPLFSEGGNLDAGFSCGFGAGDLSGLNPRLGKLRNNGGKTPTMALGAGSPAIDAGNDFGAPSTDQRGRPRFDAAGAGLSVSDCGAFEYQGAAAAEL